MKDMAKKGLWISAQKERERKLRAIRNSLVIGLFNDGLSYGDIETVIRIDRGAAYRVVKSKPVAIS